MAVADYIGLLERLEQHQLAVDARRCIMVRNRNVACSRCAASCTTGCISLVENESTEQELIVDPQKCIGCGTCATVCPTGAIEPRQPDDRQLAHAAASAMRATGGQVVFACADMLNAAQGKLDPDTVVGVPCVGRLDESMIVLLAAAGTREFRLVTGDCESCEHCSGAQCAARVVQSANVLLETWGSPARARISTRFPKECRLGSAGPAYDIGRREFLLAAKSEAAAAAHDALDHSIDRFFDVQRPLPQHQHVTADGTMPHFVPHRRQLLLESLDNLGEPADEMVETRLWGHVVIDAQKCNGCRMCAVFCPSGSLSKIIDQKGADIGLVHAPGYCLKCRTCEQICPEGALELSDAVFAVDMNAGIVERFPMENKSIYAADPDAMRKAMQEKIDSPFIWG